MVEVMATMCVHEGSPARNLDLLVQPLSRDHLPRELFKFYVDVEFSVRLPRLASPHLAAPRRASPRRASRVSVRRACTCA